jgi:hypothetical protein
MSTCVFRRPKALVWRRFVVFFACRESQLNPLKKVDEMYRSGVKPWHSSTWTPHLIERMHEKEKMEKTEEAA